MSANKAAVSKLTNLLIVPVLEQDGSVGYKTMKNTMLGELAKLHDINVPAIIKDLIISKDCDSWSERQYMLKGQLLPLDESNTPEIFGMTLTNTYVPLLVTGSTKSRVIFVEESLAEMVKNLFQSPEELLSYGKSVNSEFSCYGLWELKGVNVRVEPDEGKDLYRDGIGEISADLLEAMGGLAPLVQFRSVRSGLAAPSVAKGCLKLNPDLPARSIVYTYGQLKGAGSKEEWNGIQDLWLGVLRSYAKPGKVKESWTSIEIPGNVKVKEAEVAPSVQICTELMDIVADPIKAAAYKGLFGRDEGFSMLDQILRVAAGTPKNSKLPPLTRHPYVQLGLQDLMAAKLRGLAVDGATKWEYLVNSGTLMDGGGRAIKTSLFPVGTKLVVRRYPILIVDSYGLVTGPSDHSSEVQVGETIAQELMADHDGDCLALIESSTRYDATVRARFDMTEQISKTHERLKSTFWETDSVISRNVGSSGVGSCTYAMLSAKIAGQNELAEEMATELQKSVDSMKWSCRGDVKRAREVLEEYGLPSHIAHRNDNKQFRRPETTDMFDSPLWNQVVQIYTAKAAQITEHSYPLSAYGSIFGNKAHGLSKVEYRHLVDIYRWYCSRVKRISAMEDVGYKQEKMQELFTTLRAWSADKDQRWTAAAWMLCNSQSSKNNRAVFVFEVFRERLVQMLVNVYKAEGVEQVHDDGSFEEYADAHVATGLGSLLLRTGQPLAVDIPELESGEGNSGDTLQSVALVELGELKPESVADMIKSGAYVLKSNSDRVLPGIDARGIDLYHNGKLVAQVADADVPTLISWNGKKLNCGEVITYSRSLKVIMAR
jgi:hypothetical protein